MKIITSGKNPLIKEVKALKNTKYRKENRVFFVEGIKSVEEAVAEKADILKIYISEQLYKSDWSKKTLYCANNDKYDTYLLSDKLLKEVSDTQTPQGVLAVIKAKQYTLDQVICRNNFIIILDAIRDPGNLGTIIRTADASGVTGVILSEDCVDIYNPKVVRSTMGSIFRVPICSGYNTVEVIKNLHSRGVKVYAAHLKGKANYFELDFKGDISIVIGNEAHGISDKVSLCADMLVKIPIAGNAESLNASVAAGILMYEGVRQRMNC